MAHPMPNDVLNGSRVVASVISYEDDSGPNDEYLVLLLNDNPPYFTVAMVRATSVGTFTVLGSEDHYNIVPAVHSYEEQGGDY